MTVGLVLGAAVWPDGPSPTLRRRALHAAGLFHQGRVTHLVVCGGMGRFPPTEAHAMADLLFGAAVPQAGVTQEDHSTNTLENINFALPILRRLGIKDVLIITDHYHAPRARLIAHRLGLTAKSDSPALTGATVRQLFRSYLREVPAYLWAALTVQRNTSTST